ncbi:MULTISPECIES: hypothetical protein [Streptomyces]|uniref:hypothetical protein n=1 Tax=Streptomyces TaxID=1883 RepID=UPI00093D5A99|nr:hypothetical protein [Streptomyces sp. CB02115]OKJ53260.1 hypothetical protein AMK28_24305 [Streptomyces sp. CB02115]
MTTDSSRFFDWQYTQTFCDERITSYADKARLYSLEATFRESLHAYSRAGALDDATLGRQTCAMGLGLFRPDAIAHGKVEAALAYFARLGLRPTYCIVTQVAPHMVRDVWRYQLNVASGERICLLDLLFDATPSLLVLFGADSDIPVPCAALMADSKGEADPDIREGWELRSHLGSPHRIEVYMHIADEPIDVVRDGGILLGPDGFATAMLAPRDGDETSRVLRLAQEIERDHGARGRQCVISDELLLSALADAGLPAEGPVDRWRTLRVLGDTCEMYAGPGENVICAPGTDMWWERAGLLQQRTEYLSSRALGAESRPTLPGGGTA